MHRYRTITIDGHGTFRTRSTLPTGVLTDAVLYAIEAGDAEAAKAFRLSMYTLRNWRVQATRAEIAKDAPGDFLRETLQAICEQQIARGVPVWLAIDEMMLKWTNTQTLAT